MTRKHYIRLAAAIKAAREANLKKHSTGGLLTLQGEIMRICQEDNPAFDRMKFSKACMPDNSHEQ